MYVHEIIIRFYWIPEGIYASPKGAKGSKSSHVDKVTVAGLISKGFKEDVCFENWALWDGQVFGHRRGILKDFTYFEVFS